MKKKHREIIKKLQESEKFKSLEDVLNHMESDEYKEWLRSSGVTEDIERIKKIRAEDDDMRNKTLEMVNHEKQRI